jgi:hypothetical protein
MRFKILFIVSIALLIKIVIYEQNELRKYQNERAVQNVLILALEEINRPVDFCGTPRLQAIETAKIITGLGHDKVIEMAANHARGLGVPVNAFQAEYLLNLDGVERILDDEGLDLDGVERILDGEGNVRLYEIKRKPS